MILWSVSKFRQYFEKFTTKNKWPRLGDRSLNILVMRRELYRWATTLHIISKWFFNQYLNSVNLLKNSPQNNWVEIRSLEVLFMRTELNHWAKTLHVTITCFFFNHYLNSDIFFRKYMTTKAICQTRGSIAGRLGYEARALPLYHAACRYQ